LTDVLSLCFLVYTSCKERYNNNNNTCNIIEGRSLPYRTLHQILLCRPNQGWCDGWSVIAARGEVRNECLIIIFGKPNIVLSKHSNTLNNVKLPHVSFTSNHHQADISVHGHGMFSTYSMGSILFTLSSQCLKFHTANVNNMESHTVALNMSCPCTETST